MQSRIVLLLIALFALCCNIVQAEQIKTEPRPEAIRATKLAPGKAWSLHQSTMFLGEFDVLTNASGLRAECKRAGITFLAQAPNWKPCCYSLRSGAIWRSSKTEFKPVDDMCKSLQMLGLPSVWLIPVVQTGHKDVSGFGCRSYSTTPEWTSEQLKQFQQSLLNREAPRSAEYQACEINLPKPAYDVLERIYGAPHCALMPIQFVYTRMKGSKTIALRTDSVRQVTPAKNWLEQPANLKSVKTFNELNMDRGAQAAAEDLFGN